MRYLKTTEAATLLNVGPNTLRAWERRFGFPQPHRSPGGHRAYPHGEVAALRAALEEGHSISSAVSRARAALAADTDSLVGALLAYDQERADRAIETTLALRSVERSVEEVLLPGLETIVGRMGADSAAWAFSARWAADWLHRAKRLAPPPVGRTSIVLADASRDELDLDAPIHPRFEALLPARRRQGAQPLRASDERDRRRRLGAPAQPRRPRREACGRDDHRADGHTPSGARSGQCRSRSTAPRPRGPVTRCCPWRRARRKCAWWSWPTPPLARWFVSGWPEDRTRVPERRDRVLAQPAGGSEVPQPCLVNRLRGVSAGAGVIAELILPNLGSFHRRRGNTRSVPLYACDHCGFTRAAFRADAAAAPPRVSPVRRRNQDHPPIR